MAVSSDRTGSRVPGGIVESWPATRDGSQFASSQATSASRASLRRSKGPSTGPPTGDRSAGQRPWASGSTWLARVIRGGRGRPGRSPRRRRPGPARRARRPGPSRLPRRRRLPEDPPPGPVDQHRVERRLDPRQLRGDPLPQVAAVAQVLGRDAPDRPLGLGDQVVELVVASGRSATRNRSKNSRRLSTAESRKTLGWPSVAGARDPLGQVARPAGRTPRGTPARPAGPPPRTGRRPGPAPARRAPGQSCRR